MSELKWTYEECYEEAKKYKTKIKFRRNSSRAYYAAYRHGWINDFDCFIELCKPQNYWTYERTFEEAKKYKCKVDFQRGTRGA